MSVAIFRRRASDHVDGGQLTAYRGVLEPHLDRIEAVCDMVGEIAEDLRRKSKDPDQVAESLAAAEAELDSIAVQVAEPATTGRNTTTTQNGTAFFRLISLKL